MRKFLTTIFLVGLVFTASAFAGSPTMQPANNKSEFFIENKGQWDSEVLYLARIGGMHYWITKSGVVYDVFKIEINHQEFLENGEPNPEFGLPKSHIGHIFSGKFVDANKEIGNKPNFMNEAYYNYFIGNDESKWQSYVKLYGEVTIENIYDNIDVRYYFDEGSVRYDYIVKPNGNPNDIRIAFEGQDGLRINENGELEFTTNVGTIEHNKLYAYQNSGTSNQKIECKFIDLGNNTIGLSVGNYDASKELIIDPIVFASYIGSSSYDYSHSVTIDGEGCAIITGYTYTSNYPTTTGAYDTSLSGYDAFVSKFNSTGSGLVFSTFLGGTSSEYGYGGIDTDPNNYVYVVLVTYSSNFPVTSGCYDNSYNGSYDLAVVKLNPSGSALSYSTFLGGSSSEYPYAGIRVDENGYAYVSGYTSSSNYPTTSGCYDNSYSSTDVFVTKLNTTGSALSYSTYLGGTSSDYGYGIDIDANGNAYVTGYTYSSNFPTTSGCYDNSYNSTDIFVTKFNSTGSSLSYSTYLGGTSSDYAYGIAVSTDGKAYVTGYTYSSNYPTVSGCYDTYYSSSNGIITALNAAGSALYKSTFIGYYGTQYLLGIDLDDFDEVYITGYTSSSGWPTTFDAYRPSSSGSYDAVVAKLSGDLTTLVYSTYLGGSSTDYGGYYNYGSFNAGRFATTGYTYSYNFPVTPGCYDASMYGSQDAYVAVFSFEPPAELYYESVSPTAICGGEAITTTFTKENNFKDGNQFIVELSNENGSFTNPIEIGRVTATEPEPITGNTPDNLIPGSSYLVRIRSTSPALTAIGTDYITIYPKPLPYSFLGDGAYCEGDAKGYEIVLEDSEPFTSYQLYKDGEKLGSPLEGEDGELSFGYTKNIGTYTVEATSVKGCKNWMNGELLVRVAPTPVSYAITGGSQYYNVNGPGTYCEGEEGVAIGLANTEIGVEYQIQLNGKDYNIPIDGTGTDLSFGYIFEEGTYTIMGISKLGGCLNLMTGNITVKKLPAPKEFDLIAETKLCEGSDGNEVKLSSTEMGVTYQLFVDDVPQGKLVAGTGSQISFGTYNLPGTYKVLATNTTTNCTKLFDNYLEFEVIPLPTKYDVTAEKYFCEGSQGVEIKLSNSETTAVYELFKDGEPTSVLKMGTGDALSFGYFNLSGKYSVQAKTIEGGCENSMNNEVEIIAIPLPGTIIQGNNKPQIKSIEKYWIDEPQEGDTYLWKATNGTIIDGQGTAEITVEWSDEKTGRVEIYRKNKYACDNSNILDVTIMNILTPDFVVEKTEGDAPFITSFTNKSTGYITYYNWDFGDGGQSPMPNPTYTYKVPGKYTVKLTVGYEDVKETKVQEDLITVYAAGSVKDDEIESNSNFSLMPIEPNPATDELHINLTSNSSTNTVVAIYDVTGNKVLSVFEGQMVPGDKSLSVNISNLTNGVYFVQVESAEGNLTKFFTIAR